MVFELIIEIIGETKASGLRVLSAEYSNPGFNILTPLILFMVFESGNKLAFTPCVDAILTNDGSSLYPTPPKFMATLSIGPFAFIESVV